MATASWSTFKGTKANTHPVTVEYLHCTLNGTPTCSSHSGIVLNEMHIAGHQEESGCVCLFGQMPEISLGEATDFLLYFSLVRIIISA